MHPRSPLTRPVLGSALVALVTGAAFVLPASGAVAASGTRLISSSGTTTLQSSPTGGAAIQWPEFAGSESDEPGPDPYNGTITDRSQSVGHGIGAQAAGNQRAKSNPELKASFDGLNFFDQRFANGGNQFSVEPPDQGLCAGGGYVLESVNDVLRVYDSSGSPLTGVVDLNTFYGYPPAINRTTGVQGPFVTDPSCYYDPDTQRWFQVVLTLDTTSAGAFTGGNHLDIAVSRTSNPTGTWTIYRLPVQDNGTDGTPDHGCSLGYCLGDYPHVGADANGFYITTNEYSFFGPEYKSAQVYAFSKTALASGATSVAVTQIDTSGAVGGNPGFTVWPATSPDGAYASSAGGTEYFMSSDAAEEANGTSHSTDLVVWALTNTSSLSTATPSLSLSNRVLTVNPYAIPPKSEQKPGPIPLGECLNDPRCATQVILGRPDRFNEVLSHLDSNDTRMQQVTFANGKLWGALDTALTVSGVNKAGIAYYVVNPSSSGAGLTGTVAKQGYIGLANNNLSYPAVGVTGSGRGVVAFTVVGGDYYPSAGYAALDAVNGAGEVHVAAPGLGPDDGFTSYKAFVGNPPRTRWGDYGATAVVGSSIWMASEYIGQTCTLQQYLTPPIGRCGNTRGALGNWGTRISLVTP